MVEYFYIPKKHEASILPAIDNWTTPPNKGWTIITGLYTEGEFVEGNSLIYNVDVTRTKHTIKNSIILDKKIYTLKGFCLEGDLDVYSPVFKKILLSLEGVLEFDSNLAFLKFLEKTNGR